MTIKEFSDRYVRTAYMLSIHKRASKRTVFDHNLRCDLDLFPRLNRHVAHSVGEKKLPMIFTEVSVLKGSVVFGPDTLL
jgi:hypothetical protein